MRYKVLYALTLGLLTTPTFAITEPEYLTQNKTYTDLLLAQFQFEDKALLDLAASKISKKNADDALKKITADVATTTKKLAQEQNNLVSLKDKQANKPQLEASLSSQKQMNISKINSLNNQIVSTNGSIQQIDSIINQLENDKNLILVRMDTQQNVVDQIQRNIDRLNNDKWPYSVQLMSIDSDIRSLNRDIQYLENQKATTTDPTIIAQIQVQISQKNLKIQSLQMDQMRIQQQIQSIDFQIANENTRLNQEKNQLSILQIQLNGKQQEINSQVSVQTNFKNELNGYQSQKSSLIAKNKTIDTELDILANITTYIATSEQTIKDLTSLQAQQNAQVSLAQNIATSTATQLANKQQQIDSAKTALLAAEKNHDAVLKEFSKTVKPITTPVVLPEGTLSIDSLIVTEPIAQLKDWSVFKGTSSTLNGTTVCAASTQMLDSVSGVLSELLVLKTIGASGEFSSPFIITTHSRIADFVLKGQLKTDKAASVLMPLLQSPVINEKALIGRYADTANLISYLKSHNSAKVEFTVPGAPVTVPFSLRGSSAMVNKMLDTCKN